MNSHVLAISRKFTRTVLYLLCQRWFASKTVSKYSLLKCETIFVTALPV